MLPQARFGNYAFLFYTCGRDHDHYPSSYNRMWFRTIADKLQTRVSYCLVEEEDGEKGGLLTPTESCSAATSFRIRLM